MSFQRTRVSPKWKDKPVYNVSPPINLPLLSRSSNHRLLARYNSSQFFTASSLLLRLLGTMDVKTWFVWRLVTCVHTVWSDSSVRTTMYKHRNYYYFPVVDIDNMIKIYIRFRVFIQLVVAVGSVAIRPVAWKVLLTTTPVMATRRKPGAQSTQTQTSMWR